MDRMNVYSTPEHQPFALGDPTCTRGALLIHGFTGTPAEMRTIDKELARWGWFAQGALLPEFGRDISNFKEDDRHDCFQAVQDSWNTLQQEIDTVVLIGHSMGTALAMQIAQQQPPDYLVLSAPFRRLPGWPPRLIPLLAMTKETILPFEKADFSDPSVRIVFSRMDPEQDLDDPKFQEFVWTQMTLPTKALNKLRKAGKDGWKAASLVQAPAFIVQG